MVNIEEEEEEKNDLIKYLKSTCTCIWRYQRQEQQLVFRSLRKRNPVIGGKTENRQPTNQNENEPENHLNSRFTHHHHRGQRMVSAQ